MKSTSLGRPVSQEVQPVRTYNLSGHPIGQDIHSVKTSTRLGYLLDQDIHSVRKSTRWEYSLGQDIRVSSWDLKSGQLTTRPWGGRCVTWTAEIANLKVRRTRSRVHITPNSIPLRHRTDVHRKAARAVKFSVRNLIFPITPTLSFVSTSDCIALNCRAIHEWCSCHKKQTNSVVLVRKRTIPTEDRHLSMKFSAYFCG
jgi:hypothetical protein